MKTPMTYRLGLIVNPVAGLGGAAGLHGSDAPEVRAEALARGAVPRAGARTAAALGELGGVGNFEVLTCAGAMGECAAEEAGLRPRVVYRSQGPETSPADTAAAAQTLVESGVDLLLFAGGDGTARDLCRALGERRQPVLGIPAGVKIHSAVYAVSPIAAGALAARMVRGEAVELHPGEVRDLDEAARRDGNLRTRYFGELWVPDAGSLLQQVKGAVAASDPQGELEALVDEWIETQVPGRRYLVGPGSTTRALLDRLGLRGSVLGFDLLCDGALLARDLYAAQIQDAVAQAPLTLVLSPTAPQGHLIGRGNQQLTPEVLRALGLHQIQVLATPGKLAALRGRPLRIDSGDAELDRDFARHVEVIVGYGQRVLYPVGNPEYAP